MHVASEERILSKWLHQQHDRYRYRNGRQLSVSQVTLLRARDPRKRFPKSWHTGEDLSWKEYYEVLFWWGENNEGIPGIEKPGSDLVIQIIFHGTCFCSLMPAF